MSARALLAVAVLVTGCPADDGEPNDTNVSGATVSTTATDSGSSSSASESTSTTTSTPTGTSSSTTEPPMLDVGSTEGDMSRGPYVQCTDDTQCMDGLACLPIGEAGGAPTSHCSVACEDASSCPAHADDAPVGCLGNPLQTGMQCAVLCEMGECPEPLQCWNPAAEGAPCVPGGA